MMNLDSTTEGARLRYCILAYDPMQGAPGASPSDRSVLLLLESPTGLEVYVDPNWQDAVLPKDREYLETLLADLPDLAKSNAAGLFKQVSELNFGPLVTQEAGFVTDTGRLPELIRQFVRV